MKSSTSLFVFSLAIGLAMADVRYIGNAVHPDYPNQCYYNALEQAIPINQSFTPHNWEGHCERIHCRSDFVLEIEICGRYDVRLDAKCIESDFRLPYPSCCPRLFAQKG